MSSRFSFSVLLLWILASMIQSRAEVHVDTLKSSQGDYITLTYEVVRTQNRFTIHFRTPLKRLSKENDRKFKDLNDVNVIFVDRTGGYEGFTIEGMMPRDLEVPSRCDYRSTKEGIFFIEQGCKELVFQTETQRRLSVKIPIYLASKERKKKLRLFADCGDLVVRIPEFKVESKGEKSSGEKEPSITVKSEVDEEAELLAERIENTLERTQKALDGVTELPFSSALTRNINRLEGFLEEPNLDPKLERKIEDLLDACDAKESELKEKNASAAAAAQKEAEEKAAEQKAELERKEEELRAEQEKKAEEEKQKQTWMWIIGLVLAGGGFVGNQIWQNIRSKKNQQDMLRMQQQLAQKAEAEAKYRAEQTVKQQTQAAMKKAQDAMRGSSGNVDNNVKEGTSTLSSRNNIPPTGSNPDGKRRRI